MCPEWGVNNKDISGYEAFKLWSLTNGYSDNLSIDRVNNDGIYEPSNCRWATKQEQNCNTRQNVFVEYNGNKKTISQWANEYHINRATLAKRLARGMPFEEAIRNQGNGLS